MFDFSQFANISTFLMYKYKMCTKQVDKNMRWNEKGILKSKLGEQATLLSSEDS